MVQNVIFFYVIISQHVCSSENKLFFPHEKIKLFSIGENNFPVKLFAVHYLFSKKNRDQEHTREKEWEKKRSDLSHCWLLGRLRYCYCLSCSSSSNCTRSWSGQAAGKRTKQNDHLNRRRSSSSPGLV
jgi:hypothetical protein